MKTKVIILLALVTNFSYCQPDLEFDKKIVEQYSPIGILEAPFMINELIEIYKKDSLIVKRAFNREVFKRTEYTIYCYNVCAHFFYNKLIVTQDKENKLIIDKMISELDFDKNIVTPKIDWSNVFKTCLSCPFGEYPDDRYFYFKFSIIFMGELELKQMYKYSNGEQWEYMLEDIRYGDLVALDKKINYFKFVLDRRMASYIIERWKDSDIKEVQDLIAAYKSVM